jgi:hypothetical protein
LLCSADSTVDGADPACDGGSFGRYLWIYVWPESGISGVDFYVDGSYRMSESLAPWELDGHRSTVFVTGPHTVSADIGLRSGGATLVRVGFDIR